MMDIDRRALIGASGAALLFPGTVLAQQEGERFSWDMVIARARGLARQPYRETPHHPGARKVDYEALYKARFREDRTIWGNLPGDTGVQLFPLSASAEQPVEIALVENGRATPLRYDPTIFDAPADNAVRHLGPDAGYAGFRVMNAARDGDWLSFLGASYFRSPGATKQFGLSARAIAVNTSIQGKEEFPRFTHFWLERTGPSSLTIYALLDGASITGAYRFVTEKTTQGVRQDVDAALFARRPIAELGLMPMTSMFWYDQASRASRTDWRPEIHDSDLLAIGSADGTIHARPLINPAAPRVDAFAERNPKGFGLMQRDRNFDHYQDDGVFYERRPSLWASPRKPFGAGQVRLYAFPTTSEYVDNVCAYWTPAAAVRAGSRIDASYRLDWSSAGGPATGIAVLNNVWTGQAGEAGVDRLILDFSGVAKDARPDIWVDLAGATLVRKGGYPVLHQPGLFRVALDLRRESGKAADVRVQLRSGNAAMSEYVHYPLGA
ncbi:glucan biosynthesis protein D [Sphingomonadales bacterium 56]|uniref:glucan biosynthesis protein n=1 Tax=unclassified Sphingobium TaxID=2611147 RepID=UPI0019190976|nr:MULTISPECIES: glucan biosynthesis protein [unclassified Sphingobium]MBY2928319.1 glucan biosynthesis protein D [Sphingomonadales bacterium 56]MBY2958419.1 glucan biosynthesis protein D [Sphingomonadales bacterium 58]CAD7337014.1 Glucans biosynthesis protein D [Sphingobium sp. S6]CAD7337071.1 Glucans biosynthesis protein D [Sphingobium sp. S8]